MACRGQYKFLSISALLLTWLSLPIVSSLALPSQRSNTRSEQSNLIPTFATIRNATIADLDTTGRILLEAFANNPATEYIYQFRDKYPEYHARCYIERLRPAFEYPISAIYRLQLVEMPSDEDPANTIAVSASIWLHRTLFNDKPPDVFSAEQIKDDCSLRKDVNTTRLRDYETKMAPVERRVFDMFGPDQLYLAGLATLPRYRGRMAGESLTQQGIDWGMREGVNVTLVATEMGYPVYKSLGFRLVENVSISSIDGDRVFWFGIMVYSPA